MRKLLKKGVRNYWKSTIKLISAQRLNARQSIKGSGALSLQLEILCRCLSLDLVLAVYQLLEIQPFWLLPYFPTSVGSPCQDLRLVLSSLFACCFRHKLLVPKPGSGFQDTNLDWRFTRLIHTVPQVATRWHCPTRPSFTYLPRDWNGGKLEQQQAHFGKRK